MGTWNAQTPALIPAQTERRCDAGGTIDQLPILIDSGASGNAVGLSWLKSRTRTSSMGFAAIAKSFRFGDGKFYPILGAYCVKLTLSIEVSS